MNRYIARLQPARKGQLLSVVLLGDIRRGTSMPGRVPLHDEGPYPSHLYLNRTASPLIHAPILNRHSDSKERAEQRGLPVRFSCPCPATGHETIHKRIPSRTPYGSWWPLSPSDEVRSTLH